MDRFLIAPINTGLQTDLKPWLTPEDSFQQLNNAYVFRGRVRKRFGSYYTGSGWPSAAVASLYSRLRVALTGGAGVGVTDGAGIAAGTVPGAVFKVGQAFSVGGIIFTVITGGAGANPMLRSDGSLEAATYNAATGAYNITIAALPATQVYFYPAEPVMGLSMYAYGPINDHPAYAWDTQFVYLYAGGAWNRVGAADGALWHGDNADFFFVSNWEGVTPNTTAMFVTNFNATVNAVPGANDDPIWYYNGANWVAFRPKFFVAGAGTENVVQTARIILPFKDRLVLLNTIEIFGAGTNNLPHGNRCRFSQNGSPLAADAWLEPNEVGYKGGGWIDAATDEDIISARFIKDRLIVYFERSTWELVYTHNQVQPFLWQKLNAELGSEATFSSVPFDKDLITVGNTGIHACNGSNVARIDTKIPDDIFTLRSQNSGTTRVVGVRDYYTEMVYWTFPSSDAQVNADTYPNKVLVYNYKNGAWAFNDDCFTMFGYFEQNDSQTWANQTVTWNIAGFTWNSGIIQADYRAVIAGNQQGFVVNIDPDTYRNAGAMQLTDIQVTVAPAAYLDIIAHTLSVGDFIKIENAQFNGGAGGINNNIYQVASVTNANRIVINNIPFAGVYIGGGTVTRVSNIGILSKQWNPYIQEGKNVYLAKIDFCVDKTDNGEVTVDYNASSSNVSMRLGAYNNGSMMGNGGLETYPYPLVPLEATQERLWHPVYFQSQGSCIQIYISMADFQMLDPLVAESNFELEGMILHTSPSTVSVL